MPSSLAQAIFVAIVAGLATALMSGLIAPGMVTLFFFSLVAPMPLFLAGFAWHSLVAALAGIFAVLIVQGVIGRNAALALAGMSALPVFGLVAYAERAFAEFSGRPERDGLDLGRMAVGVVLYVGLTATLAAIIIEPDFARLQVRIAASVERVFQMFLQGAPAIVDPKQQQAMIQLLTALVLPLSALMTVFSLTVSVTLGLQIAERADRLLWPRPDFRRFRLPGGAMVLFGLAFAIGMTGGYVGLFSEIVALGLAFAYMLQGLAVVHARTIGKDGRFVIILVAWAALIIFGIPAFLFIGIGLADHLLDFRRGRL